MIRLAVSVEGQTERQFVNQVLAPHLWTKDVYPSPILLGRRGGNVTVDRLASDMANACWNFDFVTSLVDFYGFRGKGSLTLDKDKLEECINREVHRKARASLGQSQAFAYVQMHEFEGLLFSDATAFAVIPNVSQRLVQALRKIRSNFPTPEDINDSPNTAPSKRIESIISQYRKVAFGSLVAAEIGLDIIRAQCPRFNTWVTRLESLA